MIMSLYENDLPMRFGVILYSLDFIERIEKSTDKDSRNNDDLSLLVFAFYTLLFLSYLMLILLTLLYSVFPDHTPLFICGGKPRNTISFPIFE